MAGILQRRLPERLRSMPNPAPSNPGLITRTFEGAAWSAVGHLVQSLLGLLAVAVIARVLSPEVYGLFGAAMLIASTAEIVTGGALTQCLIQRDKLTDAHADVTFWTNLILSVALVGVIFALGVPLLATMQAEAAWPALICLAILVVLNAIGAVPQALLLRDMHLKQTTRAGLVANTLAAITGIAAALSGWGIWSLIAMETVRCVFRTAMLWTACKWRPRMRCGIDEFRQLIRFNLSSLAMAAAGRADQLIPRALVGVLLGPTALGLWLLARRLVEEVSTISTTPLMAVAMAAVARSQNNLSQVRKIIAGLYRAAALLGLPMYAGLIALAPWLVPLIFGNEWVGAVLPMQILLIAGLRTCTGVFNVSILRGMGRNRQPLILLLAGLGATIVLIPLLASPALGAMGLTGVALAWLARQLLTWPLGCQFIKQATDMDIPSQLAPAMTPIAAAATMSVVVYWLINWLVPITGALVGIAIAVPVGAILYVALIGCISPKLLTQLSRVFGAVRSRDRVRLASLLEGTSA